MNEHRQNNSQRNYLSQKFIRKPIILSLKAIRVTLTESWILSRKKKWPKTSNVNAKIGLKSYKTSMKQLKILKFPFKNEISVTINVQIVPENSLKTLPPWFLFRTGEAMHREETNQVEVLVPIFILQQYI